MAESITGPTTGSDTGTGRGGPVVAARRWWAERPLRVRITLVVAAVAVAALLALGRLGGGLLAGTLLSAADTELGVQADAAAARVLAGQPPEAVVAAAPPGRIRVTDTAGTASDGGPPLPLTGDQVRRLAAGEALLTGAPGAVRTGAPGAVPTGAPGAVPTGAPGAVPTGAPGAVTRYVARATQTPDGTPRLVVVGADLVGGVTLVARAVGGFLLGALAAAAAVTVAAWVATRAALRPVDRLRAAAAALPPGARLPVPAPRDELAALAEEVNRLLARRDEATARLERFTGDAAHELRSPVAAIRAQAEVAVAHPDPDLAAEVLTEVARESARLSDLLSALLALARADAGQRGPAVPVDLVSAARTAVDRAGQLPTPGRGDGVGPVVELVAPVPVRAAATPSEVALVLDNLVGNARRYARSVVRISVLPAGSVARLVVEDDGPGIPAADRRRVFDRFVRLAPDTAGGGAAGLGLALVDALVRGRGGTVAAGATPAGGARLEVRWPIPVDQRL